MFGLHRMLQLCDGAVIGGNSLVNKDVPKGAMVAGTPARIINENIEWY